MTCRPYTHRCAMDRQSARVRREILRGMQAGAQETAALMLLIVVALAGAALCELWKM